MFLNIGVLVCVSALSLLWDWRIAAAELFAAAVITALMLVKISRSKSELRELMAESARSLGTADIYALENFPLPVVIISQGLDLIWYNNHFREGVLLGVDNYGAPVKSAVRGITTESLEKLSIGINVTGVCTAPLQGGNSAQGSVAAQGGNPAKGGGSAQGSSSAQGGVQQNSANGSQVLSGGRKYTVYGSPRQDGSYQLYFVDNTELKNIVTEYGESRPVVAIIMIDSYDELMQNAKEGEKAEIVGAVERLLTNWVSQTTGFLRHSDRDKYLFVFEERHYRRIVESRFDILDKVRQIAVGEFMVATLSIGVGRGGATFAENEDMARQALDMALGRGGDQAAVRSGGGYEFYGGVSKTVEKRTKVKTRIIAAALSELIDGSDNVLIMGHRATDLDFVGAAAGLYKSILTRGCSASIVLSKRDSLAKRLIRQLEGDGYKEAFVEPDDSLFLMTPKTLLIIADTHRKSYIEYPELYKAAKTVVVIDHHRKMVDFIDNAVIFYHEPYASSASEMVTELVQYIADKSVTVAEATALLAGITLDTRNFSIRTGVRTFEAAAYLRRKGADTARVKQLFSGNMDEYRMRAQLVESAVIYNGCAIAVSVSDDRKSMRYLAPQAADELLSITGVSASFVIYDSEDGASVSARSISGVNVQLIMEKMGGGGHQTMAGAQLPGKSVQEAQRMLRDAINQYLTENAKQPGEKS